VFRYKITDEPAGIDQDDTDPQGVTGGLVPFHAQHDPTRAVPPSVPPTDAAMPARGSHLTSPHPPSGGTVQRARWHPHRRAFVAEKPRA
jgi:hypothetical protein